MKNVLKPLLKSVLKRFDKQKQQQETQVFIKNLWFINNIIDKLK